MSTKRPLDAIGHMVKENAVVGALKADANFAIQMAVTRTREVPERVREHLIKRFAVDVNEALSASAERTTSISEVIDNFHIRLHELIQLHLDEEIAGRKITALQSENILAVATNAMADLQKLRLKEKRTSEGSA